jgi:hypothetical protein
MTLAIFCFGGLALVWVWLLGDILKCDHRHKDIRIRWDECDEPGVSGSTGLVPELQQTPATQRSAGPPTHGHHREIMPVYAGAAILKEDFMATKTNAPAARRRSKGEQREARIAAWRPHIDALQRADRLTYEQFCAAWSASYSWVSKSDLPRVREFGQVYIDMKAIRATAEGGTDAVKLEIGRRARMLVDDHLQDD